MMVLSGGATQLSNQKREWDNVIQKGELSMPNSSPRCGVLFFFFFFSIRVGGLSTV